MIKKFRNFNKYKDLDPFKCVWKAFEIECVGVVITFPFFLIATTYLYIYKKKTYIYNYINIYIYIQIIYLYVYTYIHT